MTEVPPPPIGPDGFVAVYSYDIVARVASGSYPAAGCLGCGYAAHSRWLPGRTDLPAELPMHPWPDCAGALMAKWADMLWPTDGREPEDGTPAGEGVSGTRLRGAYARRARRAAGLDDAGA